MFIYHVAKQYLHCKRRKLPFEHTSVYRGFKMYHDYNESDKKPFLKMLCEVIRLDHYWNAFPDTYFRFGMFVESYNDKDKMRSFIPQDAYYRYTNITRYSILIDDKILCHEILESNGFPVPEILFSLVGGKFYKKHKIICESDVVRILSEVKESRVFVKYYNSGAGSGVFIITKKNDKFFIDENIEATPSNLIKRFSEGSFFFERQIIQETTLREFNPDTVNTIRVLTYKNKVVSAAIRFGGKGSFVDNLAKGGAAVSLDIETGLTGEYGEREFDPNKYYEHPDSHIKFANVKIEQWPEVKRLVEDVCKCLPYYKSVGFDIATTDKGPVIIEINNGAGVYLSQMGKEYGIANKFLNQ